MHIVGESQYQSVLKKAARVQSKGAHFDVALIAEPNNQHDRKAIRVDLLVNGKAQPVGYIAADETERWHKALKSAPRKVVYTWPGEVRAGKGKPVGVVFFAK